MMAFRINRCIALLILLIASQKTLAQTAPDTQPNLIDLFAIDKALAAISQQLETTVNHYGANLDEAQRQQVVLTLQPHFDTARIEKQLYQRLADEPSTNGKGDGVEALLNSELAKRVRNFEIGMQLPGKVENARQFSQDNKFKNESAARRELLRDIDRYTATSEDFIYWPARTTNTYTETSSKPATATIERTTAPGVCRKPIAAMVCVRLSLFER